MKYTLLDMTQNILSAMSSDEVNSISDSTESLQVAQIIKNKYFDIINRTDLPTHDQLIQLNSSLDSTVPVIMYMPDGAADLKWLKYFNSNIRDVSIPSHGHGINTDIQAPWTTTSSTSNSVGTGTKTFTVQSGLLINVGDSAMATSGSVFMIGTVTSYSSTTLVLNITQFSGSGTFNVWTITEDTSQASPPGYQYVNIIGITQFFDIVNGFNPTSPDVDSFTFTDNSNSILNGSYTFYYKNNRQPMYCTVLSNYYVIFDAFDSTQDSTLQSTKSMGFSRIIPTFSMTDNFTPDLAEEQFQLLLNEAKTLAFFELKQQPHQLAMQETKRGWSSIQKNKSISNKPTYFDQLPNYGRTGRGFNSRMSYFKARGWDTQ